ncbi:MAG: 23S rRNA (pseudouridine(1915)-N(3))-methyltransferase RlmH [Deltaproteobacteria bacterium]|nr:23S rRNA (pseudouridine(1915)-N(3))-methyltransferase RlmH [Deltaproteobacteria bacterium]
MKITLATIGRFKSAECERLVANYLKLAGRFATFEHAELAAPKGVPESESQDAALERFLEKRGSRVFLTLLDERGKPFESRDFAARVEKIKDGSFTEWVIAVGGAHGYGPELKARAQLQWSLSPLTFPHELAAAVAAEQVYRALTILAGHPYHNN